MPGILISGNVTALSEEIRGWPDPLLISIMCCRLYQSLVSTPFLAFADLAGTFSSKRHLQVFESKSGLGAETANAMESLQAHSASVCLANE